MKRLDGKTEEVKNRLAELKDQNTAIGDAFKRLGVQSTAVLDKIAEQAARDYKLIKESGTATAGEIAQAWLAKTEKQIAAAKAHGEWEEKSLRKSLEIEAAYLGIGKEAERAGIKGAEAGKKLADGFDHAADSAGRAKKSVEELNKEFPSTIESRDMDKFLASIAEDEKARGGGSELTGTGGYKVPNWDQMSEEMRKRVAEAVRIGNLPGFSAESQEAETRLYREMRGSMASLNAMRERVKGSEMTEELASTVEGFVKGAEGVFNKEALSDLAGAVESYRSSKGRETGAGLPVVSAPQQPSRAESVQGPLAPPQPAMTPPEAQAPARLKPQSSEPMGDGRAVQALEEITALLKKMAGDVSALTGVAMREIPREAHGASAGITQNVLSELASAARRS